MINALVRSKRENWHKMMLFGYYRVLPTFNKYINVCLQFWQAKFCTMKSLLYVFMSKGHKPRVVKLPASYCRHHAVACPLCFSLLVRLLATLRFPWLSFVVSPSSKTEGHFREQSLGPGQSQCQDSTESSHRARTRPGSKMRQ